MPTLENDRLVFRFPKIEKDASFSIDFQRTLRIPDTQKTYDLPPGFGSFPLRHVDDYARKIPVQTATRGGVMLPIWQAEALWLNFRNSGPDFDLDFPVAVKVAAGKINAVTGENWRAGLHRDPQDYMVSPEQPWLDGFAVSKGVIRQFVAMPLGEGYSVEEQLTGGYEWGGLQISVVPLKAEVWQKKRRMWEGLHSGLKHYSRAPEPTACMAMGLGAGGRMRQIIHSDPFDLDDWDVAAAERVFVTLLHAADWKSITGENAPNHPPTAKEYSKAGLPWFEHYGSDQLALPGGEKISDITSVGDIFKDKIGVPLPNSEDVDTGVSEILTPKFEKENVGSDNLMNSVSTAFELMRLELETAVDNLNSDGAKLFHESKYEAAKQLIEKGKNLQSFCDRVEELAAEWVSCFSEYEVSVDLPDVKDGIKKIISAPKSDRTRLLVKFPDGGLVFEDTGSQTLAKCIERIGFTKVSHLDIKVNAEDLVSSDKSTRYNDTFIPPYYIRTHSNTVSKKRVLEKISDELKLGLEVTII